MAQNILIIGLVALVVLLSFLLWSARREATLAREQTDLHRARAVDVIDGVRADKNAEIDSLREANASLSAEGVAYEHRLLACDDILVKLQDQRDAWRDRYVAMTPKFGAAQSMLWNEIEGLAKLLNRKPPADVKAKLDKLSAEMAANLAEPVAERTTSFPGERKA